MAKKRVKREGEEGALDGNGQNGSKVIAHSSANGASAAGVNGAGNGGSEVQPEISLAPPVSVFGDAHCVPTLSQIYQYIVETMDNIKLKLDYLYQISSVLEHFPNLRAKVGNFINFLYTKKNYLNGLTSQYEDVVFKQYNWNECYNPEQNPGYEDQWACDVISQGIALLEADYPSDDENFYYDMEDIRACFIQQRDCSPAGSPAKRTNKDLFQDFRCYVMSLYPPPPQAPSGGGPAKVSEEADEGDDDADREANGEGVNAAIEAAGPVFFN